VSVDPPQKQAHGEPEHGGQLCGGFVLGRLTVMDEEKFVRRVVARLTREHEAGEPRPWKMDD
jgi:hypothetical protein